MSKGLQITVLLAALLLGGSACSNARQAAEPRSATDARPLAQGPYLNGNDNRAWLSRSGGLSDANYCAARLQLPLDTEPAWTWDYTGGSFSGSSISSINHYEGRIYMTAYYQALACLDAADGREVFIEYLPTLREPEDAAANSFRRRRGRRSLQLTSMAIHPAGRFALLVGWGGDKLLYSIDGTEPACLWQGDNEAPQFGYLLDREQMYLGSRDSMQAYGYDGTMLWEQPTQSVASGNVLSDSGVLVSYNDGRNIWANDTADGSLLWALADASEITAMVIDNEAGCVYACFFDERMDALDIEDGALLWSYDFSGLLDDEERQRLVDSANERIGLQGDNRFRQAVMENLAVVATPDGPVVGVDFGFVFALGRDGSLRWQRTDLPPIASMIGFENGLLVQELWYETVLAGQSLPGWRSPLPMGDPPAWPRVEAELERLAMAREEVLALRGLGQEEQGEMMTAIRRRQAEEPPLQIMFANIEVLDPQDGTAIGGFELPHIVNSGFCPAQDKLVFEASGFRVSYFLDRRDEGSEGRTVLAYQWLEPGGDA